MARSTGTMSLGDLIERGRLEPREQLVIRRRSKPPIDGRLRKDGSIQLGDLVFTTPTAAAKRALDIGSVDGWLRWRVPRLGGKTLAEVRDDG
jgi:hypothetical protein